MLRITPKALDHLRRLRGERGLGDGTAARFERRPTSRLGLSFVETPEPGDAVIDGHDPRVFVASEVAADHQRSVIDVATRDGRARLVILRRTKAPTDGRAGATGARRPQRSPAGS